MYEGETLWVPERVIVSPSSGVFVPEPTGPELDEGEVIGFVHSTGDRVPVPSPFRGQLVQMYALDGERVSTHDRIAWMRSAA